MSDSREAFEKWWTERYSAHKLNQTQTIGGYLTGVYTDPRVEYSWQAWQAAQAQAGEPVAVADKGVINWLDGKQFNHQADLYTQPAVNQQLLEALKLLYEAAGSIKADKHMLKNYPKLLDAVCVADIAIAAAQENNK